MVRHTEIDREIGNRIIMQRRAMGLSRQQLSAKIGVTHQQLQKYEKGTNRVTAGRLLAIAKAFNVPMTYFFDGHEMLSQELPTQHHRMCLEVSRNFMKIKSPVYQNAVNLLVRVLGEEQ